MLDMIANKIECNIELRATLIGLLKIGMLFLAC